MTAYAVAKAAECSISTAQRILAGSVSPSLDTLDRIAKALGLRIEARAGK